MGDAKATRRLAWSWVSDSPMAFAFIGSVLIGANPNSFIPSRRTVRGYDVQIRSTLSGINAFVAYMSSWICKSIGDHDTNIVSAGAAERSTALDLVSSEHRGAADKLSMITTASPT